MHRIFVFYPILVQFFLWIDCAKSFHRVCQQNSSISYSAQDILGRKSAKIQNFWKEAICLLRFKPSKKWKVLLIILHWLLPSVLNTRTYFIVNVFYPSVCHVNFSSSYLMYSTFWHINAINIKTEVKVYNHILCLGNFLYSASCWLLKYHGWWVYTYNTCL